MANVPRGERKPGAGPRPVFTASEEQSLMPQNVLAEEGVLGSILIDPEAIHEVRRILSPGDFYKEAHRLIFEAALELADEGTPTDIILVGDTLAKHGRLEDVGGYAGISAISTQHVPSSKNAIHYARIVRTASLNRQIIHATGDVAAAGYTGADPSFTVEYAEARIAEIREELRRLEGGPRFRLKSIEEIRQRPRPQWLVPGVLQERKLWLVFGDSNTGKSFVAQDIGLCLATGTPWCGKVMPAGHIVYVCAEGMDGIRDRIDAWLYAHQMEDAPLFHVIDESPNLLEIGDVSEVIAQVQTLDAPPIAVIFDTLASSMEGGDENSPEDMGKAVAAMKRVQRECECAVMTVHHSGKDTTKGARGHSILRAAMDTCIQVSKEEENDGAITLKCDKQKDASYFADMGMRLRKVWLDDCGDLTSCTVEPADLVAKRHMPVMPKSATRLLSIMRGNPSAISTHSELRRQFEATGMSTRSFNNALDTLAFHDLIENVGGAYRLVEKSTDV